MKKKSAGDEYQIRKGKYHGDVIFTPKHGTLSQPFIITGYKNERPMIDRTVPITLMTEWTKLRPDHPNDKTYAAGIKEVYQLFVDGEMMTNARWPNVLWSDKTVFNYKY